MSNHKLLIFVFVFLFFVFSVNSYPFVVGYGSYGMNYSRAERMIDMVPEELFFGLDKLIFTNSLCVYTEITFYDDSYQTVCYKGYFEYWTSGNNRITISDFDNLSDREVLFTLLHELGHLNDWRDFGWSYHYASHDKEEYADLFACMNLAEIMPSSYTFTLCADGLCINEWSSSIKRIEGGDFL